MMSALKWYLREEARVQMFGLKHPKPSDFYLSVWQKTQSAIPLLVWRLLLFLMSLVMVLVSLMYYILCSEARYWLIYLTQWGLIINTFANGFAVAVSARCYLRGPMGGEFLTWYVKAYWVLYNSAIPLAFLITMSYWALVCRAKVKDGDVIFERALNVIVHGMNLLVMFALLISAAQPSRMLHFYQPVLYAFLWTIFSVIYHAAGGVDPKGKRTIYLEIDWSRPGRTIGIAVGTTLLMVVLHLIVVGLAVARDALASKLFHKSATVHRRRQCRAHNG